MIRHFITQAADTETREAAGWSDNYQVNTADSSISLGVRSEDMSLEEAEALMMLLPDGKEQKLDPKRTLLECKVIYTKFQLGADIASWYQRNYPTDDLGYRLSNVTFAELHDALREGRDIYKLIGVGDSLVRERLFEKLAQILGEECQLPTA